VPDVATDIDRVDAASAGPAALEARGYVLVGRSRDVLRRGRGVVEVSGVTVLLTRVRRRLVAVVSNCPHRGWPLDDARQLGCVLICPFHQHRFDLRDGSPIANWRQGAGGRGLTLLGVEERDGRIYVQLPPV
jgi:nitrite reductase (NADH) small subunit